jgi:hypothetical protein
MQKRFLFLIIDQALCVIGFIIQLAHPPSGVRYFGLFLIAAGSYAALPTVVAWLSVNLRGQTKRAVGVSFEIGIGNFGGLIASNIYRKPAGGRYYIGHGVNMGLLAVGLVAAPTYAILLARKNKQRDAEQARQMQLPEEQRTKYTIQELHELGDNAPVRLPTIQLYSTVTLTSYFRKTGFQIYYLDKLSVESNTRRNS